MSDMKPFSLLSFFVFFSSAYAGMDLPREVQRLKDLDTYRKQASMKREALVFLKVNPKNTQDHVEEAVEDYVSRFKVYGPVFLVPLNMDEKLVPPNAAKAFDSLSGVYPQLVVLDPDDDTLIVKVPYLSQDDRKKEMRDYRRTVHRYLQEKKRKPRPVPTPKPLW